MALIQNDVHKAILQKLEESGQIPADYPYKIALADDVKRGFAYWLVETFWEVHGQELDLKAMMEAVNKRGGRPQL